METRNYWLRASSDVKRASVTSVNSIFTNAKQNTLPHWIYVTLYEHVRDTYVTLTEVDIGVI